SVASLALLLIRSSSLCKARPPPALYPLPLHDALPIYGLLAFLPLPPVSSQARRVHLHVREHVVSGWVHRAHALELRGRSPSSREIGRAHVLTPVTVASRMPSSA